MTRLGRFVRRIIERLLERWHEGPEPPRRIAEEAMLFWHEYPNSTPEEWKRFAVNLANNAYRDAFVRGFEWCERCWPDSAIDSDAVAVEYRHDVSLGDVNPRIRRLLERPPPTLTPEQRAFIADLERSHYPFRLEFYEEEESSNEAENRRATQVRQRR